MHKWIMIIPPECLLIISQLNDQGHLKGFLQVLCEHEGNEVAQMQRFRRGALHIIGSSHSTGAGGSTGQATGGYEHWYST